MNKKFQLILILVLTVIFLTACGSGSNEPETVIEEYLTALVTGDNAMAVNLSCAAWEENANAEG
ncbi:MAG TPA: hypothetical protein VJ965_00270, partial [Anaerolineales bacterium]|nr:hypothetical protein [Anaerolineales bacterium]